MSIRTLSVLLAPLRAWPLAGLLIVGAWSGTPRVRSLGSPPLQQPDPKALFDKLCAACHGAGGGGDGPASAALKPRPASFKDAPFQASRTDDQLAAVISGGKPPMPAFGKQLTSGQIWALVAYVRALGRAPKSR